MIGGWGGGVWGMGEKEKKRKKRPLSAWRPIRPESTTSKAKPTYEHSAWSVLGRTCCQPGRSDVNPAGSPLHPPHTLCGEGQSAPSPHASVIGLWSGHPRVRLAHTLRPSVSFPRRLLAPWKNRGLDERGSVARNAVSGKCCRWRKTTNKKANKNKNGILCVLSPELVNVEIYGLCPLIVSMKPEAVRLCPLKSENASRCSLSVRDRSTDHSTGQRLKMTSAWWLLTEIFSRLFWRIKLKPKSSQCWNTSCSSFVPFLPQKIRPGSLPAYS